MSLKLTLIIIAVTLEIPCVFVLAEGEMRRRGQGQRLLKLMELAESGAIRLTTWHATARLTSDLLLIKQYSLYTLIASVALVFIAGVLQLEVLAVPVLPFFLVSFFGFMSIEWMLNFRQFLIFFVLMLVALTGGLAHAYTEGLPTFGEMQRVLSSMLAIFGIGGVGGSFVLTAVAAACVLTLLFCLMSVIMAVIGFGIVMGLVFTTRLSRYFLARFNKDRLWYAAIWVQVFCIILGGVINML